MTDREAEQGANDPDGGPGDPGDQHNLPVTLAIFQLRLLPVEPHASEFTPKSAFSDQPDGSCVSVADVLVTVRVPMVTDRPVDSRGNGADECQTADRYLERSRARHHGARRSGTNWFRRLKRRSTIVGADDGDRSLM